MGEARFTSNHGSINRKASLVRVDLPRDHSQLPFRLRIIAVVGRPQNSQDHQECGSRRGMDFTDVCEGVGEEAS